MRPRQDAIEAVTVTSAAAGADVGGSGAISINFVTRRASNRFSGSVYEYYRAPELNTNYWFNTRDGNPKNDVRLHQFGVRLGGPIVIPGLYDGRNKAFFFVHDEELRLPNDVSRVRTTLHPRAMRRMVPLQRDGRRPAGDPRGQRARPRAGQRRSCRRPTRS